MSITTRIVTGAALSLSESVWFAPNITIRTCVKNASTVEEHFAPTVQFLELRVDRRLEVRRMNARQQCS